MRLFYGTSKHFGDVMALHYTQHKHYNNYVYNEITIIIVIIMNRQKVCYFILTDN